MILIREVYLAHWIQQPIPKLQIRIFNDFFFISYNFGLSIHYSKYQQCKLVQTIVKIKVS